MIRSRKITLYRGGHGENPCPPLLHKVRYEGADADRFVVLMFILSLCYVDIVINSIVGSTPTLVTR